MDVMDDKAVGAAWEANYRHKDKAGSASYLVCLLICKLVEEATECEMRTLQNAHMTRAQCRRRVLDNYGIPKETWK